jgi:hypothetical protein
MAGGVTPLQIYTALTKAGASTVQAIGIMANMINESSLNVETHATDSNGYPVYGLVSWNAASYPSASQLVTGNPAADLTAQANYLKQTGAFGAASGATPAQAAGNFAANYEKCQGCQPGGSQYNSRVNNATTVSGWLTSGNWPTSAGSGAGAAGSGGGGTGPGCLVANPFSAQLPLIGNISAGPSCLFSTSNARALIGGVLMVPALGMGLVGAVLIVALGFRRVAPRAGGAAEAVGAGLAVVPGLEGVGLGVAAVGAASRRSPQQSVSRRRTSRAAGAKEDKELADRGASNVRTARRPQPRPNRPARRTGTLPGPRDQATNDRPPF